MSTHPDPDRIVRRKLSDEVFDRLKGMILDGTLVPGDPVPSERDLMTRFSVGRPAVREALQTLHNLGLITVSHGERSRVNEISPTVAIQQLDALAPFLLSAAPENLEHLKSARKMFEVGMAKQAAERHQPQDIAALEALLEAQSGLLDRPKDFIRTDMAFHARIVEIGGNPIVAAMADAMLKWLFHYHTALLHWSGNEGTTLKEHRQIIDAIAASDPEAAGQVMTMHLDRSSEKYRFHR